MNTRKFFKAMSAEEMDALRAGKAEVLTTSQTQPVAGDGAALSCCNKEEPIKHDGGTTQPIQP